MGFVLFVKHADGELRATAYEDRTLADVALEFLLEIHRHIGHEIREETGRFQAFDKSGRMVREFHMASDRRRWNRWTMRSEYRCHARSEPNQV